MVKMDYYKKKIRFCCISSGKFIVKGVPRNGEAITEEIIVKVEQG